MDLGAYANIENLARIAKANGIEVHRLRGYRLMKDEKPVSDEQLSEMKTQAGFDSLKGLIEAYPPFSINSAFRGYSSDTLKQYRKYMLFRNDDEFCDSPVGIKWDRLHGKRRKNAKYAIKVAAKCVERQWNLWNKYAGRDDVLYIHAKQGSANWSDTRWWNYEKQPWFLGAVDDAYDNVYCDIYAKIDPSCELKEKS